MELMSCVSASSSLTSSRWPAFRCSTFAATTETRFLPQPLPVDVFEASSEGHLQGACNLRVFTFNDFPEAYRIQEHRRFLSANELDALKEKIVGKKLGFGKVTCVVATVPSKYVDTDNELALFFKLSQSAGGQVEDRFVIGSLDLNKTHKLPDELCGNRPQGVNGHSRRGYLSNVCVAKAVQRNGVGTKLIKYAQKLALHQGITDLYTHVAVDNEMAKRLYTKSGFVVEQQERVADARLMGRPAHLLLWLDVLKTS